MKAALKTNINTETLNLKQNKTLFEKASVLISIIAELTKIKITFFVAISTGAGYFIFNNNDGIKMVLVVAGVLLFASASAALNHYQERDIDAKMARTKYRPIPAGKVSPKIVLLFAALLILSGTILLYQTFGKVPLLLAFLTLVWYNIIYTPLKRKSKLAIFPGSLIGAIPPMIGWAAAGGDIFDPSILAFAAFLLVWQIPHFWLLMMRFGKEYEKAGLPSITESFSPIKLGRSTYLMISVMVLTSLLLVIAGTVSSIISSAIIIAFGVITLFKSAAVIKDYMSHEAARKTFILINIYVLLVVFVIISEKTITVF